MPREIITAASPPTSGCKGPFEVVFFPLLELLLVVVEVEFLEVVASVVGKEVSLKEVLVSLLVFSVVCEDETGVEVTLDDVELSVELVVVCAVVVVSVVEVVTVELEEAVLLGVVVLPSEVLGLLTVLLFVESTPRIAKKIERTQRGFICVSGRQIKIIL